MLPSSGGEVLNVSDLKKGGRVVGTVFLFPGIKSCQGVALSIPWQVQEAGFCIKKLGISCSQQRLIKDLTREGRGVWQCPQGGVLFFQAPNWQVIPILLPKRLEQWKFFPQLSSSLTVSPGWAASSSSAVCPGEAAKVTFDSHFCLFLCIFHLPCFSSHQSLHYSGVCLHVGKRNRWCDLPMKYFFFHLRFISSIKMIWKEAQGQMFSLDTNTIRLKNK